LQCKNNRSVSDKKAHWLQLVLESPINSQPLLTSVAPENLYAGLLTGTLEFARNSLNKNTLCKDKRTQIKIRFVFSSVKCNNYDCYYSYQCPDWFGEQLTFKRQSSHYSKQRQLNMKSQKP